MVSSACRPRRCPASRAGIDGMDLDVGEDIEGYEPIDIEIGLQGAKRTPTV